MHLRKLINESTVFAIIFALSLGILPMSLAQGAPHTSTSLQAQRPRTFPPPQYIPSHNFDTQHIALNLHFDWDREILIGNEMIVVTPLLANLSSIELDAANMTFASIKLDSGTPLKYEVDQANQKLRIQLDRVYHPSNTIRISIDYQTNGPLIKKPGLVGTGLRFIKPTADDPSRPRQIWSQGESEYNHYWFPCYDHPNDFFTSELTATVEKPLSVISNGKLVETTENKDGTRTFHWQIDAPHASYLTSIVVGEYVALTSEYDGIPVISNVYPNEVTEGKATTARLAEMVKFFSEKTGVKYPYAKYAQTMARDFGGGMENISATTQTDNMIHDARAELDQTSDGLESHELAHQWFGDYLTCRSWSDIWLNESFATYFQAMWDEYKLGHDDFLYADVKGNQDQYFATWKQGNRHPIVTKNYSDPDAVFDTYAYPRGGAVLHMLRKTLGEDNWWHAINYYLRKYAHQPVQTEQFRVAIEEATGQSMDSFFDEWIYRMGHPVFRVTQKFDEPAKTLTLTIEQIQKTDPESKFPQAELFQMPVDIEIGTAEKTVVERVQIEPKRSQTFAFKTDSKPLLVNFDYNQTIIKELEFNKTKEELSYQLSKDQDVLGRLWALNQLTARLNSQTLTDNEKQQIATTISQALQGDSFWGIRAEAATSLAGVKNDIARNALLMAIKDQSSRVRARALKSLGELRDASLASIFEQSFNDPSYAVIRSAAVALGQTKSPQSYPALTRLLDTPSWRDTIKVSAILGLAASGDERATDLALRYAAPGNQSQVRSAAIRLLGDASKNDPRSFPVISDIARAAVDKADFNLITASLEAMANLGDPRGLTLIEELSKKSADVPRMQDLLAQYQERLRKNIGTAARPATTQP